MREYMLIVRYRILNYVDREKKHSHFQRMICILEFTCNAIVLAEKSVHGSRNGRTSIQMRWRPLMEPPSWPHPGTGLGDLFVKCNVVSIVMAFDSNQNTNNFTTKRCHVSDA